MGPEKLRGHPVEQFPADVAVYTIRGLLDLADMAAARGDKATARWASHEAVTRALSLDPWTGLVRCDR